MYERTCVNEWMDVCCQRKFVCNRLRTLRAIQRGSVATLHHSLSLVLTPAHSYSPLSFTKGESDAPFVKAGRDGAQLHPRGNASLCPWAQATELHAGAGVAVPRSVTAASQQRHSSVTAASQQRHSSVTAAFTAASQQRHSSVTAAPQQRHSSATPFSVF